MKPIVAVVALFGLFERCQDLPLPPHDPGHTDHPGAGSPAPQRDAGPSAPDAATDDLDAGPACSGPPGFYADDSCCKLASSLKPYRPLYELWADGADKERYIDLPANTHIDTVNPDRWSFPVGTRIYKTFSIGGKRIETRLLEKTQPAPSIDSWTMTSYLWSSDQRSVSVASADGVKDALGTSHDIPSQAQCKSCHKMPDLDAVNGFGAIQLNHGGPGWTLRSLIDAEVLVNGASTTPNVTLANARIPGDAAARAALGYLHGNCGNCHGGPMPRAGLKLWSVVGSASLSDTGVGQSAVCQCLTGWRDRTAADGGKYLLRIAPGDAAHSGIVGRMSIRKDKEQMPPLGSEIVDDAAVASISRFIDGLDASGCDMPCPPPPPPMAGAGAAGGAGGAGGAAP